MKVAIENVSKSFGMHKVLKEVNLSLEPGLHALLGPNGAGKTTLMRCMLGLVPFRGRIQMPEAPQDTGYLPQQYQIFRRLKVHEALQYVAALKNADPACIPQLLEQTRLGKEAEKPVGKLSGGMLRRLGIAQALLGEPKVLILDEPTVGLDPNQRVHIRELIAEVSKNKTVLLSTHIVEDAERIADYVAMMDDGAIVRHAPLSELLAEAGSLEKVYMHYVQETE